MPIHVAGPPSLIHAPRTEAGYHKLSDQPEEKPVVVVLNSGYCLKKLSAVHAEKGLEVATIVTQTETEVLPASVDHTLAVPYRSENFFNDPALVRKAVLDLQKLPGLEGRKLIIDPGWGWKSEFPEQYDALSDIDNVSYVSPSRKNLDVDKAQFSKAAEETGLFTTIPRELVTKAEQVKAFIDEHQFDALIKHPDGGGGQSIKLIPKNATIEEITALMAESRDESKRAFGENKPECPLLVTQYIAGAKHIEVQMIGDKHGNVEALGARDCSLQQKYQKLLEVSYDDPKLLESAKALGEKLGVQSTCTFEFLRLPDGNYVPLEANWRLQVEHHITDPNLGAHRVAIEEGKPLKELDLQRSPKARVHLRLPIIRNDGSPAPHTEAATSASMGSTGDVLEIISANGFSGLDKQTGLLFAEGDTYEDALNKALHHLRHLHSSTVNRNYLIQLIEFVKSQGGPEAITTDLDFIPDPHFRTPPSPQEFGCMAADFIGRMVLGGTFDGRTAEEYGAQYKKTVTDPLVFHKLADKIDALPPRTSSPMKVLKEQGLEAFLELGKEKKFLGYVLRDEKQHLNKTRRDPKAWKLQVAAAQKVDKFTTIEVESGAFPDSLPRDQMVPFHTQLEETLRGCTDLVPTFLLRDIFMNGYRAFSEDFISERLDALADTVERALGRTSDNRLPCIIDNFLASNDPRQKFVTEGLKKRGFIVRTNICITPDIKLGNVTERVRATREYTDFYREKDAVGYRGTTAELIGKVSGAIRAEAGEDAVITLHAHNQQLGQINRESEVAIKQGFINGVDVGTETYSTHPSARLLSDALLPGGDPAALNVLEEVSTLARQLEAPWDSQTRGNFPRSGNMLPGGMSSFYAANCKEAGIQDPPSDVYNLGRAILGATADVTPFSQFNGRVALLNYLKFKEQGLLTAEAVRDHIAALAERVRSGDISAEDAQKEVQLGEPQLNFLRGQFGEPVEGWNENRDNLLTIYGVKPLTTKEVDALSLDVTEEKITEELNRLRKLYPKAPITRKDALENFMYQGDVYANTFEFMNKHGDVMQNSYQDLFYQWEEGGPARIIRCGGRDHRIQLMATYERKDGTRTAHFKVNGRDYCYTKKAEVVSKQAPAAVPADHTAVSCPMHGQLTFLKEKGPVEEGDVIAKVTMAKMEMDVKVDQAGVFHPNTALQLKDQLSEGDIVGSVGPVEAEVAAE